MINILFRTAAITDTISDIVEPYITQVLDAFGNFSTLIQAFILLGIVIFTLVGIIAFIKKFIKLFFVLAVIGGIAYVLFTQGYLDSILSSISGLV